MKDEISRAVDDDLVSEAGSVVVSTPRPSSVASTTSRPGKRKSSDNACNSILEQACTQLKQLSDNMNSRKRPSPPPAQDDCHLFALHVAENLRQIKDLRSRAMCRLKIEEVLFQFQFGLQSNPQPFNTHRPPQYDPQPYNMQMPTKPNHQPYNAQVPPQQAQSYQPPAAAAAASSSYPQPVYHDMDMM